MPGRIEDRAPLGERQFELMMTVLIRSPEAFTDARQHLTPEDFAADHLAFANMWAVLLDHFIEFGAMPTEEQLMGEVERRADESMNPIIDQSTERLQAFVSKAYEMDPAELNSVAIKVAAKYLKQYLEDRLSDDVRSGLNRSAHTPSDLCEWMDQYKAKFARIQSLELGPSEGPFPKGWFKPGKMIPKTTTHMPFLDRLLQGGQAPKEVYGLVGPIGSCKTTFALQYITTQALVSQDAWEASGRQDELPVMYMFFYESDLTEMRLRALAAAGCIDRSTLESRDLGLLSTRKSLKPYEQREFANQLRSGLTVFGEKGRMRHAEERLSLNMVLCDMTGNDPNHPGRGGGLHDELVSIIQADQQRRRSAGQACRVGAIVIDYAGAAVTRYMDMNGLDPVKHKYALLSSFGMNCKNKLAIRFETYVWALHQLNSAANARASGTIPKSTEAMGLGTWKENLDFSLVVGVPDKELFAVMTCDKTRRTAPVSHIVVKINGALGRIELAENHVVDTAQHRIVHKDHLRSVDGDVAGENHYESYADDCRMATKGG